MNVSCKALILDMLELLTGMGNQKSLPVKLHFFIKRLVLGIDCFFDPGLHAAGASTWRTRQNLRAMQSDEQ